MDAFVAVTDNQWFQFLRSIPELEEANFWRPGGGRGFQALAPGEPLLFKLHAPFNFIVGGGFFTYFTTLPVSLAWETFTVANGASSYAEMRARVEQYRKIPPGSREDYQIGCLLLEDPFFLPDNLWIPAPADFKSSVQVGKKYDLSVGLGLDLWQQVLGARATTPTRVAEAPATISGPMYGVGKLARIRLRQGAFRVMVTDAYQRRCAISGEKALPVLQAAHIRPVAVGGEHRVDNGLLLRSDVHTLFDRGYISLSPNRRVLVSSKLKDDFNNGEPYYQFRNALIHVPTQPGHQPSRELLEWHSDTIFRR